MKQYIKYFVLGIFVVYLGIMLMVGLRSRETEYTQKIAKLEQKLQTYESKYNEVTPENLKGKPMPSYAKPSTYTIVKVPKGYLVQLSGGTVLDGFFASKEEAQAEILERADRCKQRWIETGGLDF